jgi:hypothetical protein
VRGTAWSSDDVYRRVAAAVLTLVAFALPEAAAAPSLHRYSAAEDAPSMVKEKTKEKDEEESGTLDTFETEASAPDSLRPTSTNPDPDESEGEPMETVEELEESVAWWAFLGEYALVATVGGAIGSWYRVTGLVDEDLEAHWGKRRKGEPTIPFVALNVSYQSVESDVDAYDVRAEGGFGPFGAQYRFTRFKESDPETELDLSWLHGMLRMSYTRYVEVGVGFGGILLDGAGRRESGGSFALPVRIEPLAYVGLDYRPIWGWINGNTVSDHDLTLRVGVPYVSIRGGYRWTKAGASTLEGPIVGLLLSL